MDTFPNAILIAYALAAAFAEITLLLHGLGYHFAGVGNMVLLGYQFAGGGKGIAIGQRCPILQTCGAFT